MKTSGFPNLFNLFRRDKALRTHSIAVVHQDRKYDVLIKRSSAARRLTLRIRGATGDIVLTIPAKTSLRQAQEFAERHADWIENRLAALPQRAPFLPGEIVPLRDVAHRLHHCPRPPGRRGAVWVEVVDGRLCICANGEPSHFERRVTDFLRQEARRDLEKAVFRHTETIGRRPISLSLRDTASRWGSCSAKGALNFSWRLILAPPFVLDYLAAHETAHLRHHNHSEEFWALTRRLCPNTDQAEAWLKVNGAKLHRYGSHGSDG